MTGDDDKTVLPKWLQNLLRGSMREQTQSDESEKTTTSKDNSSNSPETEMSKTTDSNAQK